MARSSGGRWGSCPTLLYGELRLWLCMFVPAPRRMPTICSLKCSSCGHAAASRPLGTPHDAIANTWRERRVDWRTDACQMGRHWCPLCRWFVALCLPQQFYCFLPATQPPDQIHGLLELRCDVMTMNKWTNSSSWKQKKKKNTLAVLEIACTLQNAVGDLNANTYDIRSILFVLVL